MKRLSLFSFFLFLLLTATYSCGEDRSGEQPFAPTLRFLSITIDGDSALLTGEVLSSPNSTLTECGFIYGNDTLRATTVAPAPTTRFTAATDSLGSGDYYAVPYAKNRVGTSYADTARFTIPE